jgi:hypothetical protein
MADAFDHQDPHENLEPIELQESPQMEDHTSIVQYWKLIRHNRGES